MTTRKIIYADTDLHHQVRISVVEAQIHYLPYKTSLGAPEVANYSISLKEVATQGDSWNPASVEQEETVVFVGLEEQDWPIRITHPDTAVCS